MKNICKYTYALFITLGLFSALQMTSCKVDDIPTYSATKGALWFEKTRYDSIEWVYYTIDTIEISATFFPGIENYTHQFKVNLVGNILTSSLEYKLALIDSLTDIEALKYIQLEKNPTFKAGVVSDSVDVIFDFSKIPEGFRGRVTYELAESDFFHSGIQGYNKLVLWVNNIATVPLWWDDVIIDVYLGEYSETKFAEFVAYTGVTSLEKMDASERREVCLEFKKHITKNNIMDIDEDGNEFPMEIPIY